MKLIVVKKWKGNCHLIEGVKGGSNGGSGSKGRHITYSLPAQHCQERKL